MLSFGIEYERAFSIAFASARFAPGSAPPSFAATMIARDSFEKSLPRFASAAPFLCLIVDHLLCPDTRLLPPLPYPRNCRRRRSRPRPRAKSRPSGVRTLRDGGLARTRLLEPRLRRAHGRRLAAAQVHE